MVQRLNNPNILKEKLKQPNTTREFFFSTGIYFKDLKNSKKLNNHLLKHITQWKNRDEKGIVRSNSLGWHSAVDMHHRKEYLPLLKELFTMQQEIFKHEGYHPETEPFCDNMWANVNYKYSSNRAHVHPGALWSGVYYIKCPKDCGNIWFIDPCGQRHMDLPILADKQNKQPQHWREVHYQPYEGRLIMFPGWLEHEVGPNMSDLKGEDGWRVSVSFNFKQRWVPNAKHKEPKGHASGGIVTLSDVK